MASSDKTLSPITREELERILGKAQHDINNPLACVIANLEYAVEVLHPYVTDGSLGEVAVALGEAAEAAQRIKVIVEALRAIDRTK